MALTYRFIFLTILVMASLFGFLSTAPTRDEEVDYLDEHWYDPSSDSQPVTSTTPAPERADLSCEKTSKKYDNLTSDAMKDDIKILMNEYNDWGKLLAPAPVAIGILGQLILMANQIQDFPISNEDSKSSANKTFEFIKYPNSFRTTLLQISQKGYSAFLTAHRNMDAVRLHNSAVPTDIKDAVRYLASENPRIIELRLPPTWARIDEAAKRSQALSKEVVDEFNIVLGLIDETELAVSSTKSIKENKLEDTNFDIKLNNQSREFSEKESSILMEKDSKMKEMLDRMEFCKDNMYIWTSYHGGSFTMNLAKDWIQEMGVERYKKDGNYLKDTSKTWTYYFSNEFVDNNPCAQANSEQLLDLLVSFGQYRSSYEHWKNSPRNDRKPFSGSETINNFEVLLKKFKQCTEIDSLILKGNDLIKKLKNSNTFLSLNKRTSLPCEAEINDITITINNLRTAAKEVTRKSENQVKVMANSAWEIYGIHRRYELSQLDSMSKTVKDIVKLNNDLMEIRRKKTKQILEKIANLNITKVSTENVIEILREGLSELGILKNHWGEMIKFFGKIRTFIESASRHSTGLVQIIQAMSKNQTVKDTFMIKELRINFEKSNEAVLLVHGIANMYVDVSNLYIKDRLARLNTLNSMRIKGATNEELKQEKGKLTNEAEKASQGIVKFIQRHEKELSETLQTRHNGILREYRKMLYCVRKHGLQDRAKNFTGADYWFQIKSRKNGKVIEVSSENQVQIWESNNGDNQLWYLDQGKIIRSVINNFCLTSNGLTKSFTLERCQDNSINQKWTLQDGMILNIVNRGRCLNIHNGENINGARLEEVEIGKTNRNLWEIA